MSPYVRAARAAGFAIVVLTAGAAAGCGSHGAPPNAAAASSHRAADAAPVQYGHGPAFQVKGAYAFFDDNPEWWAELDDALVSFGTVRDAAGNWQMGLFRTDGTTTTMLRTNLFTARDPFRRSIYARLGDVLYFPAREWSSLDPEAGFDLELWRTDGTPDGTYRVVDLNPGFENPSTPRELTVHRGEVYFVADVGAANHLTHGIYATDGTAAGTRRMVTIQGGLGGLSWLTSFGDRLLYSEDGAHGIEPWVLEPNGTAHELKNIMPDGRYVGDSNPVDYAVAGGKAFFGASYLKDDGSGSDHGLYVTDGTSAGTSLVTPLLLESEFSSYDCRSVMPYGDRVLAVGSGQGSLGYGLFASDGTAAGTVLLHTGSLEYLDRPVLLGDEIVYRASEPTFQPPSSWTFRNHDLWASDGTPGGAHVVKHFCDACDGAAGYGAPVVAGGYAFLAATDDAHGRELWRTDGTPEGTVLVEDRIPGPGSEEPFFLGHAGDLVYFAVPDDLPDDPYGDFLAIWAVRVDLADLHPPDLNCPAQVEVEAMSGSGAPASYEVTATDNLTVTPAVAVDPPSGSLFPLGSTLVTATASDEAGNQASCSFPVIVADHVAPSITCPADVQVEAAGPSGAPVSYADAQATDAVSTPVVTYDHPSGAFPLGRTVVTATAADDAGNHAACTFLVTVVDTVAPALTCPADVVAEATSADGAAVSFDRPAATDLVSTPAVVASPASGSTFALGDGLVTITATDTAGNAARCTFHVRVADTTPPALTCPASQHATAAVAQGAVVEYPAPVAADLVTAAPTLTMTPPTGSLFPVGTTAVTAAAVDQAGNRATCAFDVVVDAPPPLTPTRPSGRGGCESGGTASALALLVAPGLLRLRRRRGRVSGA